MVRGPLNSHIITLLSLLICGLTLPLPRAHGAPGAGAAGPNDFDRFRHASPPQERSNELSEATTEMTSVVRSLVEEGQRAFRSHQYDQAIADFSNALNRQPQPAAAVLILRFRAEAYILKGELERALADSDKMVQLAPGNFRGYQVRGRVYRRKGQPDKAIAEFTTALRLNPRFAQLYNNRGIAFDDKGQHQRAIQDYNEAIRLAPQAIDSYVNRGGSYYSLKQFDRAMADYNHALQIDSSDADTYFNRAVIYEEKGDLLAALADYTKAARLNPSDPAVHEALAQICAKNGDFDSAVKNQLKAINTKSVDAGASAEMQKRLRDYQQRKPEREEVTLHKAPR
jgi:tetratricopeptide (TPR) repeat protein